MRQTIVRAAAIFLLALGLGILINVSGLFGDEVSVSEADETSVYTWYEEMMETWEFLGIAEVADVEAAAAALGIDTIPQITRLPSGEPVEAPEQVFVSQEATDARFQMAGLVYPNRVVLIYHPFDSSPLNTSPDFLESFGAELVEINGFTAITLEPGVNTGGPPKVYEQPTPSSILWKPSGHEEINLFGNTHPVDELMGSALSLYE